jgi:lipopolysaccharide transport protein LptA
MENSHPKVTLGNNNHAWPVRLTLVLLSAFAVPCLAEPALPELQSDMPITIDADSSEFDYETSRLIFHGLRMDQGNLGIEADVAETDKLDFTNGQWVFTGNVIVEAENAKLYCDKATMTFVNHQLISAELQGTPATFNQYDPIAENTNIGEANNILYRLDTGTLELSEAARFSDGANEISGELITYDIAARHLSAGSGNSGPVKILIESPGQLKEDQSIKDMIKNP